MSRVIITGGSRGIGRAAAELFAERGHMTAYSFNATPPAAPGVAIKCDVASPADCERFISEALNALGGADALICCAGASWTGLFQEMSDADYDRLFDVNMKGVFNVSRAAAPHFIHQKRGSIVAVASMWGICGASCEAVYAASKAAVIGFVKSLARELAPSGVRVNCLAPGAVDTDMLKNLSAADRAELINEIPFNRLATPREMAEYLHFLASPESAYLTGQVLSPNGGLVI